MGKCLVWTKPGFYPVADQNTGCTSYSLWYWHNVSSLGKVAGKVFRIGHLGSLTDVMALSGIANGEMALVDLSFPVSLGSGVSAAQ